MEAERATTSARALASESRAHERIGQSVRYGDDHLSLNAVAANALEMTESAFNQDPTRALIVLTELHALAVLLAFDDFGTGYSSFNDLKESPVDFVKIDQTVTSDDLGTEPANHALVSKTIELAHLLGIKVISEGVETEEQHEEREIVKTCGSLSLIDHAATF